MSKTLSKKIKDLTINDNDDELVIRIKKSSIRGAGKGAFAGTFIKKGDELGEYKGKRISEKEFNKLKNTNYVFEVTLPNKKNVYIDAKNPKSSSWHRYVNGAKTKLQRKKINTHFYQYGRKIYLRATKDIPVNTELICDYGEYYWE